MSSTSSQRHPNAILMEKLCAWWGWHGMVWSVVFYSLLLSLYTTVYLKRTRFVLIFSDILHGHENVNSNQLCFSLVFECTVFALFPFQTSADSRNMVYSLSASVNNCMYFRNCTLFGLRYLTTVCGHNKMDF